MSQNFHALPDLEGYQSAGAKKVRELVGEWQKAFETVGTTETEVEQAKRALGEAKTADVEARAVAERKGKPDPGRRGEEKARAELAALEDRMSVVRRVLSHVEADLTAALIDNAPEIAEEAISGRCARRRRVTPSSRPSFGRPTTRPATTAV